MSPQPTGTRDPGDQRPVTLVATGRVGVPWGPRPGPDTHPSCRLGLCTFTLAVALGAVLLLPFSIISNEVLLSFPQNYYIQWLNGSLVHGGCRG